MSTAKQVIERLAKAMNGQATPAEAASAAAEVDALFAAEQERVYAICLKFLNDRQKAQEAAQDVLLIAYTRLPEFRGESSFRTWLYNIARYRCWDIRRKRSESLDDDGLVDHMMDGGTTALTEMRREERLVVLRQAMQNVLTPLEQKAVHLRYVEQVSQDQISEILGLDSASGARGLLQKCRRKLNREIRRQLDLMGHSSTFVRGTI